MKLKPSHIVILFLIGVIIFLRSCPGDPPDPILEIEYRDTTLFDTVEKLVPEYIPQYFYQDTGSIKWRDRDIDTNEILKIYFSRFIYDDTLVDDTNAFIVIRDVISENRIQSREPFIQFFPKTVIETTVVKVPEDPRRKVFLGFGAGRSFDQFGLTGNMMFINKRDQAFAFQYDFINKDVYVTTFFKLRLGKRK